MAQIAVHQNLGLVINQPVSGIPVNYTASGLVYSNSQGEIFLEASGRDMSGDKAFVKHRPYIVSVQGLVPEGTTEFSALNIYISGKPFDTSGNINLYMQGPESASVYNTVGLHTASRNLSSGTMNMALWNPSGVAISGSMNLHVSGTVSNTARMNMRIRGK